MKRPKFPLLASTAATLLAASALTATPALAEQFSIPNFSATANNADGSLDTQAGDHPFSATTSFELSGGDVKDTFVELPPGFIGNPQATAQCPLGQLHDFSNPCPSDTQIGTALVNTIGFRGTQVPVYNLVPEPGQPAEFGFLLGPTLGQAPAVLYPSVRTSGDYGVTVRANGIVQGSRVTSVSVTLWGVPADSRHDHERGSCLPGTGTGPCSIGAQLKPFLTNPTQCVLSNGEPNRPITRLIADSWQSPAVTPDGSPDVSSDETPNPSDPNWVQAEAVGPALTGCGRLTFEPTMSLTPDTTQADAPSGDHPIDLKVPQQESASELATPELRNLVFTAPQGVTVNPGAADGLAACSDQQFAVSSAGLATCPDASQIGSVQVTTPLLAKPLEGEIYLGQPGCGGSGQQTCSNADAADGGLIRVFIQVLGPGVVIKQLVHVAVDPSTGQITATATNIPQQPFSDLVLRFNGGPRALFINPLQCGAADSSVDLTPWSSGGFDGTPDAIPAVDPFIVDWDGAGGACPSGLPFTPGFLAQTSSPLAAAFSPFTVAFSRPDRNQRLSQLTLQTPPGLLGMLSSVPLCGEPQATDGSCPASSQIATATAAAGTGTHPFYLSGPVYLTGPYKGAPFGLSVAVPAVAGPFNLGTVVVRAAINVNPSTAQITVTSDPLPQILDGVQTHIQSVNVTVDRPAFMFNPTNCTQQAVNGTIYSAEGTAVPVSSPFAAAGCPNLPFKPSLTASTQAKTSKADGASLTVKVASAPGQANIGKVDLIIPKQLPSRLTTLQKACTAAQFETNPAGCPRASIIGTAKAVTPVLNVPLVGPAMLVSHGGASFPDVEFLLQGQGVTIVLDGKTQIKAGITYSRFETVPDAPISSFETVLPRGPYSILGAYLPASTKGSLCGQKLTIPTTIEGQNGALIKQTTKVSVTGCPKAKAAKRKRAKTSKKARKATKTSNHNGRAK